MKFLATRSLLIRAAQAIVLAAGLVLSALPASAVSLIRDAEIEDTLKRLALPILQASGVNPARVRILIVDDPSLNAFVTGGDNIFLHTGLLTLLETPEMIQAVIAHELGHITGGHLARRGQKIAAAQRSAALGLALAVAAGASGSPEAGAGIAALSAHAAQRNVLAYSRAEEATADQSGLAYMARAGIDPNAMIAVLNIFKGQELLARDRLDPYALSHPLSSQRIRYLEDVVATARLSGPGNDGNMKYWHARMVAKFNGFLMNPKMTLRRIKRDDNSEMAVLGRAIAAHKMAQTNQAVAYADALIRARPKDQYYREMKGQFLLEAGQAQAAVTAYRSAAALDGDNPLILAGLGRALLAAGAVKEARTILTRANDADGADARVLRDLALAHAKLGDNGLASLATAERYALQGGFKDAARHARRASDLLPTGSPSWRRAQDILSIAELAL